MGLWDSMDGQWTTIFLRLPPSKASRILRRTRCSFPRTPSSPRRKQSFLCDHSTQVPQGRFYNSSTKGRTAHLFTTPDSSESALRGLLSHTQSPTIPLTRQTKTNTLSTYVLLPCFPMQASPSAWCLGWQSPKNEEKT